MRLFFFVSIIMGQVISLSTTDCVAQEDKNSPTSALVVGYSLLDFKSVADLKTNSLSDALNQKKLGNTRFMSSGIFLQYLNDIDKRFTVMTSIAGSFLDYPIKNKGPFLKENLLIEAEANIQVSAFLIRHLFNPYLQTGFGISRYKVYYGMYYPIGTGMKINLSTDVFLNLAFSYRIAVNKYATNHLSANFGVGGIISNKRKKQTKLSQVEVKPINFDRDYDKIADTLDACPDIPGLKLFNGCPDSDNDSIPDHLDNCPTEYGLFKFQGCPSRDYDGDGIEDAADSCKAVPGFQRYAGCPIPDIDQDGINDEIDSCVIVAGTAKNYGCPELTRDISLIVDSLAKNVFFNFGEHTLTNKSYETLDALINVLTQNSYKSLIISAHTDNIGTQDINLLLSKLRAKTIFEYLVGRGIDPLKMDEQGYGELKPVATIKTNLGRSQNRRVEFELIF